tara:strand:- start:2023 stop:3789 length:1767 start_codon:yes stop_codon:yes gene_type:complete
VIARNLVTTAIEATWPKKEPIIFLGSWCCSFSRKPYWSSLDFEIVKYHWDDRKKLANDYKYLELTYEIFLEKFTNELNKIHSTSYSNRFWRILIGPWLYTCIQILFDRWYMLDKALKNENNIIKYSLGNDLSSLVADDMDSFNHIIETDEWNETLYSLLLKTHFSSKVSVNYVKNDVIKKKSQKKISKKNLLKSKIIKLSNKLSHFFSANKSIFIIAPQMSFIKQILLHIRLKQFPVFWFNEPKRYSFINNSKFRDNIDLLNKPESSNDFEDVLNNYIFKLIPRIYLEGFKSLLQTTKLQGWPNAPESIFTSNSYASDENFKCWAGHQVDLGSKLIIGQHGGNFGMTPMAIHETHQFKISDKWLSWGWSNSKQKKIIPVGNFKSRQSKMKSKTDGDALLVSMTLPKFSYYLYSVPIASQMDDYFTSQLDFAKALPKHIREKLKIRLYPLDRDWNQKERWQSEIESISFDNGKKTLLDSLTQSRIFIGTYNATTYLETFSVNMPSILFWNPNHWELNEEAMNYFNYLIKVKVLHFSPQSAASHLTHIWDDIDNWWFSNDVQEAVINFNNHYSKKNSNIINTIAKHLKYY